MSSVDKGSDFFTSVQSVKRAISLEQVFRRKNPPTLLAQVCQLDFFAA